MTDISRPRYPAHRIFISLLQRLYVTLCVCDDALERDGDNVSLAHDFPIIRRAGFGEYHRTAEYKKLSRSPFSFGHLGKGFGNLTKMLQSNAVLVPQNVENAQRNDVRERVDSTEGYTPVFFGEPGFEKVRPIPVSELSPGDAGQSLDLVLAERGMDLGLCLVHPVSLHVAAHEIHIPRRQPQIPNQGSGMADPLSLKEALENKRFEEEQPRKPVRSAA